MKVYTKNIQRCDECPNAVYQHFDGEGESCAYSYWFASCSVVNKSLPHDHVVPEPLPEIYRRDGYVPKRRIPIWCPLPDEK